jgi:hypothetical protein
MQLAHYLTFLHRSLDALVDALRQVAEAHADEPDVRQLCTRQAEVCRVHTELLLPFVRGYAEPGAPEPERLHTDIFVAPRGPGLGLLRDLHDLYLMTAECDIVWTLVGQAAQGARDRDLLAVVGRCEGEMATQLTWLRTRLKQAAPQVLVVS